MCAVLPPATPPALMARLARLEAAADAASRRFEALHAEHETLKRRHRCKEKKQAQALLHQNFPSVTPVLADTRE